MMDINSLFIKKQIVNKKWQIELNIPVRWHCSLFDMTCHSDYSDIKVSNLTHQSWSWCSHRLFLCCSLIGDIPRNYHIHHTQTALASEKKKKWKMNVRKSSSYKTSTKIVSLWHNDILHSSSITCIGNHKLVVCTPLPILC